MGPLMICMAYMLIYIGEIGDVMPVHTHSVESSAVSALAKSAKKVGCQSHQMLKRLSIFYSLQHQAQKNQLKKME